MLKKIALVLAVVMMFVMVSSYVMADDKPVQKDKAACCQDAKSDKAECTKKEAGCCDKAKTDAGCTKDKAQCPHQKEAAKSACKEACKSSCPASSACKSAEGDKK
jgi:hypothetical protein